MSQTEQFDAVVIGAGQAGGPLATALAGAGQRVAIIERKHYGGTCVNIGCTPTKTMIASGRVAYLARRAADYGVGTGDVSIDQAVVRRRKRDVVASFNSGSTSSVHGVEGLEAIDGQARFTDPKELVVTLEDGGERRIAGDRIFVNVGERPAIPPIDGMDDVPYLTSTTVMELGETPRHLVVIGAGVIAMEFSQLFRRLGAQVTVLVRGDRLLGREDDEIADSLRDILAEDGIDLRFETQATRVSRTADGIALELEGPDGPAGTLDASHLLVATGRTPNTNDLGLDAAGIDVDKRGYIRVDERLETNVSGVYALGDVKGGPAFTHISYDDFRIVRDNLLKGAGRTTTDRIVPYTMFTDPQLGRVGLTEQQAREQGHEVRVATLPMSSVARAIETDETRGLMKAVVDAKTDRILGAAILGIDGGEVATVLQVAMMGGLPYTALRDAAISHPTVSESLNNLFMTLD
ncbi:MAG TPA: mercuric reductase [Thermomicrobiales bacterium]|jgi:pyruvate/2-oxoglutarate dehydrogenase complex dihydrolipoamide dehydrogenase (E3) component|nr:mercuric reductase [Thermomicrobiales bacterium]